MASALSTSRPSDPYSLINFSLITVSRWVYSKRLMFPFVKTDLAFGWASGGSSSTCLSVLRGQVKMFVMLFLFFVKFVQGLGI